SCARTTGPNVSQSSYHAAWSLQRSRPMKPVVMGVSMSLQGYDGSPAQRVEPYKTQRFTEQGVDRSARPERRARFLGLPFERPSLCASTCSRGSVSFSDA